LTFARGLLVLFSSAFTPAASANWTANTKLLYAPESVHTYDDADTANITYGGTWTAVTQTPNTMSGTLHWTQSAYSYATLSFNGSTVTYFYSMSRNRGHAYVYIGADLNHLVLVDTISLNINHDEILRKIGKTWTVSPGNHVIKIVAQGDGLIDLDAIAVDIAYVGIGSFDERTSLVRYAESGQWIEQNDTTGAFYHTIKYSYHYQNLVRLTFVGNAVTYVYSMANNRGIAGITIDGVDKGHLDLYNATTIRRQTKSWDGLGGGVHIINIMVTGAKNGGSINIIVDVDAIDVLEKDMIECRWSPPNPTTYVKYKWGYALLNDPDSQLWLNAYTSASGLWNAGLDHIYYIHNESNPNVQFDTYRDSGGSSGHTDWTYTFPCTQTYADTLVNVYNDYGSDNARIRHVIHEVGHGLLLGHIVDGTVISVMGYNPDSSIYYYPQTTDYLLGNSIYP
jgi:hypothetical protein